MTVTAIDSCLLRFVAFLIFYHDLFVFLSAYIIYVYLSGDMSVLYKKTHVNEWFIQLCFCKCTSFSDIWPSFIPWVFEDLCLQVCNLVIMLFQGMLNFLICSFDQRHWWVVLSVFSFIFMKVWNSCARLFRHDRRRWCEISLPQVEWRYSTLDLMQCMSWSSA